MRFLRHSCKQIMKTLFKGSFLTLKNALEHFKHFINIFIDFINSLIIRILQLRRSILLQMHHRLIKFFLNKVKIKYYLAKTLNYI